jgi:hypothetical protein
MRYHLQANFQFNLHKSPKMIEPQIIWQPAQNLTLTLGPWCQRRQNVWYPCIRRRYQHLQQSCWGSESQFSSTSHLYKISASEIILLRSQALILIIMHKLHKAINAVLLTFTKWGAPMPTTRMSASETILSRYLILIF